MAEKLQALLDNRTFYFTLGERKPDEVVIHMYSTKYILVRKEGTWENYSLNHMAMSKELIQAVLITIGPE